MARGIPQRDISAFASAITAVRTGLIVLLFTAPVLIIVSILETFNAWVD